MTNLKDLCWEDIIPHSKYKGKTVQMVADKNGKEGILYLLRNSIPLSDEVIEVYNIRRIVNKATYENYFVDPSERESMRDTKVYKKETASKEKILKEILTLEQDTPESEYKTEKDDVDLIDAVADTLIDETGTYDE